MSNNVIKRDTTGRKTPIKTTKTDGVHTYHANIDNMPGQHVDAFSRLRVSEPRPVGDYNLSYGLEPLLMEQIVANTGNEVTFSGDERMATLALAGTATGHAKLQSYQYHYYQPGRSHAIFLTGVLGAPVANTIQRLGYFDDDNGVFIQQDGDGTISFVLRSSTSGATVDTVVPSDSWAGQPGWTIDPTKNIILGFDLQFLGMGMVRCFEDRGGKLITLHTFDNEQAIPVPYMQTATLPIRAEIIQDTAAPASLKFKCASVMTEGGTDESAGMAFSIASNSVTAADADATHAISIQPRETFGGLPNRTMIELDSIDILVTGNSPVLWELVIGDAITGITTFNAVNADHSAVEYNLAGTTSQSPSVILASGYIASGANFKQSMSRKLVNRYPITLDAAGLARPNGRLTLLLTGVSANSTCYAAMNWREIR